MENQIQTFVLISSVFLGIFVLITVYLIIKLKLNDILLKKSEEKLQNFNDTLQYMVAEKTEELQKSEKKFRLLFELYQEVLENSPAGIIKLDKTLKIEYWNPEIQNILNSLSQDKISLEGRNINDIAEFKTQKMDDLYKELYNRNDIVSEIELNGYKKKIYMEVKGVPISENDKFSGAVLVLNDITKNITAEEKLKQSFEMLKKSTEDIIQAMASTSEMRDPYTAGHQKRVRELAIAIGNEMKISKEQLEGVKFAGIVHDIGKISVPSDILSKPGKISNTEFEVIKGHSQTGYDLLNKIEFPWPISEIVYQHHERMDGSGYPRGLKDDEILLEARILSVADVVEAMTSHRPYRAAYGIEKALEEIEKYKGKYYDPKTVDACFNLFKENKFVFSNN
ncbi:MAG: HD domain-containing protein [Candidatus Cloacimonetes bacterium]|nr:HD domain-containing protein [Candidatus Cloacimonadota bacterium]MBL7149393.1 HD domain-containing protein [Candidatus Cloacimonadota bacterium]